MGGSRIGVDFGTTNSVMGFVRTDGTVSHGSPVPSVLGYDCQTGHFELEPEPGSDTIVLRDLKLSLGTNRRFDLGDDKFGTAQIVANLFEQLSEDFGLSGADDVSEVVMGTPVRASREHRIELRQAAALVGWNDVRLVYEPTAALMGRPNLEDLPKKTHVLVVDWGGGTLDIAVVRVQGDVYREIAVGGDMNDLGGTFMDRALAEWVLGQTDNSRASLTSTAFDLLLQKVESQKIKSINGEMRSETFSALEIDGLLPQVTDEIVEEVCQTFVSRAVDQIYGLLELSSIDRNEITHVLCCGGVCLAGPITDSLMKAFPNADEIAAPQSVRQMLTMAGCATMVAQGYRLEMAGDFSCRESDRQLCVLIPKGEVLEPGRFRIAEFLVGDILANEAVFEFGVSHMEDNQESLLLVDPTNYVRLQNSNLRVGLPQLEGDHPPARVRMYVGLDEHLTVGVHLESSCFGKTGEKRTTYFNGIPLAIRMGNSTD